jgi:hypothetical protein
MLFLPNMPAIESIKGKALLLCCSQGAHSRQPGSPELAGENRCPESSISSIYTSIWQKPTPSNFLNNKISFLFRGKIFTD